MTEVHRGIAVLCIVLVADVYANLPLHSSSFQGGLHPQFTVTDSDGSKVHVVDSGTKLDYSYNLPPKKKMKTKKLAKRLGEYFDPEWMSVDKPDAAVHKLIAGKNKKDTNLVQEMSSVNLTLFHSNGSRVHFDSDQLEAIQTWMIERASCPIHYVWIEQGERWWPRWLKTGVCVDDKPCSWPPGMHCVPAETKVLHLLRWHCRSRAYSKKAWKKRLGMTIEGDRMYAKGHKVGNSNNLKLRTGDVQPGTIQSSSSQTDDLVRILQTRRIKFRKGKKKCKWLKVPYPVTSKCYCTC